MLLCPNPLQCLGSQSPKEKNEYLLRLIFELGVSPNFKISEVACGLKFHWYLKNITEGYEQN